MNYKIRKIRKDDYKKVAQVVTMSWNETYKDIVPKWFLDELKKNEEERANQILVDFENNNYLVLEVNKEVVGFVWYGIATDEDYKNHGEIKALYIIKKYQGNGYGKELFKEAVKELKKMKFDKMIISCLKKNPANEFYKHMGGIYLKDGEFKKLKLPENIYYFNI